jgi:hypothetical protein
MTASNVGIGFYPIHIYFLKHIHVYPGFEWNYILHSDMEGKRTISGFGRSTTTDIDLAKYQNPTKLQVGPSVIAYYEIKISDQWQMSPQYKFYIDLQSGTFRSMRQNVSIGIKRKLK